MKRALKRFMRHRTRDNLAVDNETKLIRLELLSVIMWRRIIQFMLFSKIVVAVDGSERSNKVYDVAAQLAKLSNGELIIVHVVAPPLPVGGLFYTDVSGIDKI